LRNDWLGCRIDLRLGGNDSLRLDLDLRFNRDILHRLNDLLRGLELILRIILGRNLQTKRSGQI
jgi:hypothetical protein